uniref:Baculoviral IAP repeat-containing protein n=1 Tax=Metapenaeus joyneri majanivirus TaxID=2984280 RepID=A0A9C7EYU0_9VIRU|nr:MAG: baculoviral IAP repeat-containing protein [Metapenaeus joyneri majanivirus]
MTDISRGEYYWYFPTSSPTISPTTSHESGINVHHRQSDSLYNRPRLTSGSYPECRPPPPTSDIILHSPYIIRKPRQKTELNIWKPFYDKHMDAGLRRTSFPDKWPEFPKVKELVEAGFFSIGVSDRVCCFYCGVILEKWEKDDIPWNEHARHFPSCKFVIMNKGQNFIDNVIQNRKGKQEQEKKEN